MCTFQCAAGACQNRAELICISGYRSTNRDSFMIACCIWMKIAQKVCAIVFGRFSLPESLKDYFAKIALVDQDHNVIFKSGIRPDQTDSERMDDG